MGVACTLLDILSAGFFPLGPPAFLPTFFLFFLTHILENCLIICFWLGRASHRLLTLWLKAVNKYIIFSKCIFTLQNGRKVSLWLDCEAFTWWCIWFRAQQWRRSQLFPWTCVGEVAACTLHVLGEPWSELCLVELGHRWMVAQGGSWQIKSVISTAWV